MCVGGKRYATNMYMYAALVNLYYGIITQTARRRESVPCVLTSFTTPSKVVLPLIPCLLGTYINTPLFPFC